MTMSSLTVVQSPPDRLTEQVAAEVRAQMARVRITQTQLADALELSQPSISKRLRGVVAFNTDEIQTVARVLGVHPAAFFGAYSPSPNGPVTAPSNVTTYTISHGNVTVLGVSSQPRRPGAMRTTRPAAAA